MTYSFDTESQTACARIGDIDDPLFLDGGAKIFRNLRNSKTDGHN
jgi:hypothetical protein